MRLISKDVDLELTLSTDQIRSGEPLEMLWRAKRTGQGVSLWVENDDLQVIVQDIHGKVVVKSAPRAWRAPNSLRHMWNAGLEIEPVCTKALVFHEWCGTEPPPGQYNIICLLPRVGLTKPGGNRASYVNLSPPAKWRFPLEVRGEDAEAVRASYQHWLDAALGEASASGTASERVHASEMITYARGDAALPFQFALLKNARRLVYNSFDEDVRVLDTVLAFIDMKRPDVARKMANLVEEDEDLKPRVRDILIWALHEMHDRGGPEIAQATAEAVKKYPRPRDPRPVAGLD